MYKINLSALFSKTYFFFLNLKCSKSEGTPGVFCRRVCVRKRKGTPVKVCDRAYVTEDEEEEEEESLSEHSYSPGKHTHTHVLHGIPVL